MSHMIKYMSHVRQGHSAASIGTYNFYVYST